MFGERGEGWRGSARLIRCQWPTLFESHGAQGIKVLSHRLATCSYERQDQKCEGSSARSATPSGTKPLLDGCWAGAQCLLKQNRFEGTALIRV
jgi:hypothetical protein